MAAIGKFSRRSEDTKLPTFRLAVVHKTPSITYIKVIRIKTAPSMRRKWRSETAVQIEKKVCIDGTTR